MGKNYDISPWFSTAHVDEGYTDEEINVYMDVAGTIDLTLYSLEELLVDIGPHLSEDASLIDVSKALKLIAPVLDTLVEKPRRHQVHILVEYLCARIENQNKVHNFRAGIREIASALKVVSTWDSFPPGDASVIASAIFTMSRENAFKDQPAATRVKLFMLIESLVHKYEKALRRDMGAPALVQGIVSMGLAEKSPICLGVLFPLYTHISRGWELEPPQLNEMWDSFIRYFPVSVGNAAKDPSIPSTETMRTLLLKCIVSNDHYSTQAFERLIDMLDSSNDLSANSKKEAFSTLVSCIQTYTPSVLAPWTVKLWDALKFEIWNGESEDFISGALNVLSALAIALKDPMPEIRSKDNPSVPPAPPEWTTSDDELAKYVIHASSECRSRINDSKRQYLLPSARILHSLAATSPYAFHLVTITVLPALLVMWQDVNLESEKKMILGTLNKILEARLDLFQPELSYRKFEDPESFVFDQAEADAEADRIRSIEAMNMSFAKFRHDIIKVFVSLIADVKALVNAVDPEKDDLLGLTALRGFTLLFRIPGYLSLKERKMVASELCAIAQNDSVNDFLHRSILNALREMSASEPDIYRKTILEHFTSKLPKFLRLGAQRQGDLSQVQGILEDLIHISCSVVCQKENDMGRPLGSTPSFWYRNFDTTIYKLLWVLDEALKHEGQLLYVRAIVVAVCLGLEMFDEAYTKACLTSKENIGRGINEGPYTWIVRHLFRVVLLQKRIAPPSTDKLIYIGISNLPNSTTIFDDTTIEYVGRIAMLVLRSPRTRSDCNDFIRFTHGEFNPGNLGARLQSQPSAFWTFFTTGDDLETIARSQFKLQQGPKDKCLANALSMYMLAGFVVNASDFELGIKNVLHFEPGEVAAAMIYNAVSTESKASNLGRMSMLWTLQLMVNKYRARHYSVNGLTTPLYDLIYDLVSGCSSKSDTEVQYVLQTLAYLTAASVAALTPDASKLVNLMLSTVSHVRYGMMSAKSFRILLAPSPIINRENSCTVRGLRESKVFHLTFKPLRDLWIAGDRALKTHCLIALAGILGYIDAKSYAEEKTARLLLPLVLDGTDISNDSWAKAAFVKSLNNFVLLHPSLVQEHIKSAINRMTERTHNTLDRPSNSDITSRVLALGVLENMIKVLPLSSILKEKKQLTMELNLALDDPSREVRERAQRCKTALLCLVEPTTDA